MFYLRYLLCALWLLAVAAGLMGMARYENTAGGTGTTPDHWPSSAGIALDAHRPTLVMFAHPKCPCTRASVEELNRLLVSCGNAVSPHVLFYEPTAGAADWKTGGLWESASAIPGVGVEGDVEGKAATLFGAETSGYVVLYAPDGKLLFKGGITGSRGHAGDNAGETAIASLLLGQKTSIRQTAAFGCSIFNCPRTTKAGN